MEDTSSAAKMIIALHSNAKSPHENLSKRDQTFLKLDTDSL